MIDHAANLLVIDKTKHVLRGCRFDLGIGHSAASALGQPSIWTTAFGMTIDRGPLPSSMANELAFARITAFKCGAAGYRVYFGRPEPSYQNLTRFLRVHH